MIRPLRLFDYNGMLCGAVWRPRDDITAYELAQAQPVLMVYAVDGSLQRTDFDVLPDGVKRHFEIL